MMDISTNCGTGLEEGGGASGNSVQTEPASINDGWHTYTLGDIYTERKETGDPELPILTVSIHSGVSDGALDEDEIGKTVKRIADKTQYKTARAGDLVFNMMRAWQGAIGVARSDGLVSPAYIVAAPNEEQVFPLFMDYYMKTPRMVGTINRQSYGVTDFRKRLYWDSFAPIKCTLPSIPEQQKIAEILTAQDKVIELQEKLVAELTKLKKAYLSKMFPRKGEKVPELRFKGFTDDWERRKLNEFTRYSSSSVTVKDADENGKYDLYDANTCIGKTNKAPLEAEFISIIKDGAGVGRVRKLPKNVSILGTMGAIMPFDCDYGFLYSLLEKIDFSILTSGGTIPHIYYKQYGEEICCVPSREEQKKIGELLHNLDNIIALHQRKLEQEKQKKKALMQLLLTGIVRIKQ